MPYYGIVRINKARGFPNTYWISVVMPSWRSSSRSHSSSRAVGSEKAIDLVMRGYPLPGATPEELDAARAEIRKRIIRNNRSSFPVRISARHEDPLSSVAD